MATIRDIARFAGVSVPTVSRVLNDHPVDADLTRRVREAARELNYVPNRSARRLRGAGTRLIGAIFPDISNPFYTALLRAVERALPESTLLIANSNADRDREKRLILMMREEGVAGLIIAAVVEQPETLAPLVEAGFPLVVVDRRMRGLEADTVHTRNFEATLQAVGHLARIGHRRIAFIGGPHSLSTAHDRHAGYLAGLAEAGLTPDSRYLAFGDFRMASGRVATTDLLSQPEPPTAILVANNEMLIGALNHIHTAGFSIPHDVAVVGFDDFPWSVSLNPPLTAIAQPVDELGKAAARLLTERMADPGLPYRTVTLDARLVVRASCGAGSAVGETTPSPSNTEIGT